MELNSIVAVAHGGNGDARVLFGAALLAKHFGAEALVLPAFADAAANLIFYGASLGQAQSPEIAERLEAAERAAHEKIGLAARAAAAKAGLADANLLVGKRELSPAAALTRASALSDLVLFAAEAVERDVRPLFVEALLTMRAPILLLKTDLDLEAPAAIAWDGSMQAGRALRAATPLLRKASRVLLLTNEEDQSIDVLAARSEHARAYLAHAGVAKVDAVIVKGPDVALSLLDAARVARCGLLVAGGYGRPRLQELVLGGATRAFVNAEGAPNLLLAH